MRRTPTVRPYTSRRAPLQPPAQPAAAAACRWRCWRCRRPAAGLRRLTARGAACRLGLVCPPPDPPRDAAGAPASSSSATRQRCSSWRCLFAQRRRGAGAGAEAGACAGQDADWDVQAGDPGPRRRVLQGQGRAGRRLRHRDPLLLRGAGRGQARLCGGRLGHCEHGGLGGGEQRHGRRDQGRQGHRRGRRAPRYSAQHKPPPPAPCWLRCSRRRWLLRQEDS